MKRFLMLFLVLVSIHPSSVLMADDQKAKILVEDQARGLVFLLYQLPTVGSPTQKAVDATVSNPARLYTPVYQYAVQNSVTANVTSFDLFVGYAAFLEGSIKRLELHANFSSVNPEEWNFTRLVFRNPDVSANKPGQRISPTDSDALSNEFFSDRLLGQTLTSYKSTLGEPSATQIQIEPGQIFANGLQTELILTYKDKIAGYDLQVVASAVRTRITEGKIVTNRTQTTINELSVTAIPIPPK